MSYCRWSTDDFQCDLYCYEGQHGYVTHVASRRPVYREPLPPRLAWPEQPDEAFFTVWIEREAQVREMLDRAHLEPLGLPHDGATFEDESLEAFEQTLLMLRAAGYRFPDNVLECVRDERAEETHDA